MLKSFSTWFNADYYCYYYIIIIIEKSIGIFTWFTQARFRTSWFFFMAKKSPWNTWDPLDPQAWSTTCWIGIVAISATNSAKRRVHLETLWGAEKVVLQMLAPLISFTCPIYIYLIYLIDLIYILYIFYISYISSIYLLYILYILYISYISYI